MNPRIEARTAAAPQDWPRRTGFSWHHIIPSAVLIAVWNRLVDQQLGSVMPEARTALGQHLRLCGVGAANVDELVDRMRVGNTAMRHAGHNPLRSLDDGEVLMMQSAAAWPPWNAVQGPDKRRDDPENRYMDRFTFGLTPEESARMRAIETLFNQFQQFIGLGPNPGPASFRTLAGAESVARSVIGRARPIEYRADMWVALGDGWWRKNR